LERSSRTVKKPQVAGVSTSFVTSSGHGAASKLGRNPLVEAALDAAELPGVAVSEGEDWQAAKASRNAADTGRATNLDRRGTSGH
jgi:hypothetical protein